MISSKKKILAISGSTKQQSLNLALLKAIAATYSDRITVDLYDGIDKMPHFNPDKDNETPPESVVDFRNRITESDGVIICTPEYVFSLPGSLKNAIEWTVSTTIFSKKPVALIVAAASGEKAVESLKLIMSTLDAVIPANGSLLIKGAKGKIGPNGVIADAKTDAKLNRLMDSFLRSLDE
ncbi:NADPH-dependent FMN reductase [Prolixibacter sp. NT017]|uniref:NADPH-dependent FMN reductase n=1 Tax=Prolixibacter sp. NT017 TaxID=2652390 RepID=UPI0012781C15|nr:NAD(P)H-dependent oxidoreductase [Prolixibacter sp. NT017]GET26025.1 FMN reductase [Prolixibacter sp. NT017]